MQQTDSGARVLLSVSLRLSHQTENVMRLKALDQIHISSVQADSLRRGQIFHVSDVTGAELLMKHPALFERLDDSQDEGEKAEGAAPLNKALLGADKNKAANLPVTGGGKVKLDYAAFKNVGELKAHAAGRKIDLGEATKRSEIIAVIEAADAAEAEV
jgi:hypothetical protein